MKKIYDSKGGEVKKGSILLYPGRQGSSLFMNVSIATGIKQDRNTNAYVVDVLVPRKVTSKFVNGEWKEFKTPKLAWTKSKIHTTERLTVVEPETVSVNSVPDKEMKFKFVACLEKQNELLSA